MFVSLYFTLGSVMKICKITNIRSIHQIRGNSPTTKANHFNNQRIARIRLWSILLRNPNESTSLHNQLRVMAQDEMHLEPITASHEQPARSQGELGGTSDANPGLAGSHLRNDGDGNRQGRQLQREPVTFQVQRPSAHSDDDQRQRSSNAGNMIAASERMIPLSTSLLSVTLALVFGIGAWVGMNYANTTAEKSLQVSLFSACHDYEDVKGTKFCQDILKVGISSSGIRNLGSSKRAIGVLQHLNATISESTPFDGTLSQFNNLWPYFVLLVLTYCCSRLSLFIGFCTIAVNFDISLPIFTTGWRWVSSKSFLA